MGKKKLETDPRSIKGIAQELSEEKGEEIGPSAIRRVLQAARYVWKRMRKVPAQERDEEEFRNCQWELEVLQQKADGGKLDLYYFDEAGFSLTPCVPYGWQPVGQTWCLPAASGRQLNVLGFYSRDSQLDSYVFEGPIDSHVVAGCFDLFCERLTKPTVVVLDNASIHTSDEFEERIEAWARRGLTLKYLPPYCPELNLIEILWRKIKYEWLPLAAYASFQALAFELETVLRLVGSKYQITFV